MSNVKEAFRKGKILFLCVFVVAQIFIPQATVEAATCKHTFKDELISTTVWLEYNRTFEDKYEGKRVCRETVSFKNYAHKCTKCGLIDRGYSNQIITHSHPNCPNR